MADWQKVILTGGIIGSFFLGGIMLKDALINDPDNPPNPQPEPTLPIDQGNDDVPPSIEFPPDSEVPPDSSAAVNDITSAYGKYTDLIQTIPCEIALEEYGEFNDWGYWEGGSEVCDEIAQAG